MNAQDLLIRLRDEGLRPSLKLRLDGDVEPSAETLELVRQHKEGLVCTLVQVRDIPRLPWQLEALLRAANSDVLPKGMQHLESGLVFDLSTYALACAASYLIGDREEALRRLWQAYRAWQGAN